MYHVREMTSESSAPPELDKVIKGKLEHLVKGEREVLVPVMKEYYDLICMIVLVCYRAPQKVFTK